MVFSELPFNLSAKLNADAEDLAGSRGTITSDAGAFTGNAGELTNAAGELTNDCPFLK